MTTIRDLTEDDLDAIVRWRNDAHVNRYLSNQLRSQPEVEVWFNSVKTHPKIWLKAIIDNDQIVGYAAVESIDTINRKCELAMVIGVADRWGRGIGATVLQVMLAYAFDTLGMHRVWAAVARGNDRSERLLRRAGFRQEGIMRETLIIQDEFTDLLCFSILEDEYRTG
ncbi:MAG: GNAT family N-acetyltransferase [candidate division Zixibacteria bacterium]|nr:GNAT family N-acetyltransferase [candidate division Zixibacteria bacterium]